MVYRIYKYGYYILYHWWVTKHGKNEWPVYNSLQGYTLLLFINLLSAFLIWQAVTGIKVLASIPRLPKIVIIVLLLIGLAINYFTLVYRGKYKAIVKEFESKDQEAQKRKVIEAWFYIIGSFVILFISAFAVYLRDKLGF